MRIIKNLMLVFGLAVAIAGLATTSAASLDLTGATASGVDYEWYGDFGVLSVAGEPGTTFAAYDSSGNAVAGGVLESGSVSFLAGNSGVGPNGALLYVIIDNDVVAVTDPDWDWN